MEEENQNNSDEMENNQEEYLSGYKIMAGNEYFIKRQDYNDKVFYKIKISQKGYDGTKEYAYKEIKFKKGVDIQDGTKILLKRFIENFYFVKNDKYNARYFLMILDFEITEMPQNEIKEAIQDFQNNDSFDLPF